MMQGFQEPVKAPAPRMSHEPHPGEIVQPGLAESPGAMPDASQASGDDPALALDSGPVWGLHLTGGRQESLIDETKSCNEEPAID
jgi:hypothetical protein